MYIGLLTLLWAIFLNNNVPEVYHFDSTKTKKSAAHLFFDNFQELSASKMFFRIIFRSETQVSFVKFLRAPFSYRAPLAAAYVSLLVKHQEW